jgi:hypothetical protein
VIRSILGSPSRKMPMYEPHQWYELGLLRSPGWVRLALEMRAGWEYGASIAATPLLSLAPRGDGHPVLVFPGLITGDLSTLPLRNYLSSRGYATTPGAWESIAGHARA